MTEHYTKEEAVELARECGVELNSDYMTFSHDELQTLINAAVSRKLAEKELEVVRLREAITKARDTYHALLNKQVALYGKNGELTLPIPKGVEAEFSAGHTAQNELFALLESTPSSTKHLDEYVAGKVKELRSGGPKEYREMLNDVRMLLTEERAAHQVTLIERNQFAAKLAAAEDRVKECDKLMSGLRDKCGYVEDGSYQTVRIFQDDATYDWFVTTGLSTKPVTIGTGRSFHLAIKDAIERSE